MCRTWVMRMGNFVVKSRYMFPLHPNKQSFEMLRWEKIWTNVATPAGRKIAENSLYLVVRFFLDSAKKDLCRCL